MDKIDTFGARIKRLRQERGLNIEPFADIIGVTKGAVSLWENNKVTPKNTTIKLIAKMFVVSYDYLLTGDGSAEVDQLREKDDYALSLNIMKEITAEMEDIAQGNNLLPLKPDKKGDSFVMLFDIYKDIVIDESKFHEVFVADGPQKEKLRRNILRLMRIAS